MTEPFVFANGQIARNAEDLIKLCQQFPDDSVNHLIREDFEKWLSYIGATKIAQYATEARQASVADHQKLDAFISKSQAKPQVEVTPAPSEPTSQVSSKPKVNLFTAIANFFSNLSGNKNNNKSLNT